ncbi:MAG: N-6 DNA methylase [Polyangiaceae bacterium]|nr:N-6 DNA methylase [Polyangiaceae bacterium]
MMEGPKSRLDRLVGSLRENPARLSEFQKHVTRVLRDPWIHHQGQPVTLAAYLDASAASGSLAAGDEQAVVDQLGRRLLEALGYGAADYRYNSPMAVGGSRGRPDYTVHLAGAAVNAPLFVLEDKSTFVRDLRKKQPGRANEETPVEQLRRYTRSGRVRGNAGLLCNGWSLEGWQFSADGDSRVVHLDLYSLAKHAVEKGAEPLPETLAGALNALWIRFSRSSFEEAFQQKPLAPRPTEEWDTRIRDAFKESPEKGDQVVDQHYEEAWRVSAINVATDQENLVQTLRTLIDGFTDDVRHQLDDALIRAAAYEKELDRFREQKHIAELRTTLAGSRRRFNLSEEDYDKRVVRRVEAWIASPKPGEIRKLRAAVRDELTDHVVVKTTQEAVQHDFLPDGSPKVIAKVSKADQEAQRRASLESVDGLVRDLCAAVVAGGAERARIEMESGRSIAALQAFRSWVDRVSASVMVGADNDTLRSEFARQTAYVYIIRLLLVRICEDKGLFQRKLSDGGLIRWEELAKRYLDYASGRSYEYLTQMAYECAQNVYLHFYGASHVFDWYQIDEKMLFRAIIALNAFDLRHINTDIIGTVYGQYLLEGKHEQGRYYTPEPLVKAMLDTMGYRGGHIVGRRLGDLACGSGSFLVEACRRLLHRYMVDGCIPTASIETALEEVQRSFFGLDINPFACYLAETNLLIQVLDLVKRAQEEGLSFTVDRFAIYSTDSLLVNRDLTDVPGTDRALFAEDVVPELAKARSGDFKDGFHFLIGNPPYVRADEKADHYIDYRRRLEEQEWFTTRHLKWDLYVPFVQQYQRLLSDDKDARACLVTIESLATAPYAEKLRELLTRRCTIYDVLFLEKLGIFTDAIWQDNIVFCFSRGAPAEDHKVERRIARKQAGDGSLLLEPLDIVQQTPRLFNKRAEVTLDLKNTLRFDEICYVTVGMVLNSDEKIREGELVDVPASYDPNVFGEQIVEDRGKNGKTIRHKPFGRDDLVSLTSDRIHARRYINSREILRGGIGSTYWLEYGPHTRCPGRVRRPTFPELYGRPKIMFGTFTGVAVDDGAQGDFLTSSDSVRLAIRWHLLEGVEVRALTDARNELKNEKRYAPALSRDFSEWYLCALALSEPIQKWLHANKRSMKEHVYPEDIKAIPVKRISPEAQQPYIDLAKERHQLWSELVALEAEGYEIGKNIEIPVHALVERFRKEHPKTRHLTLAQAMAAGLFRIEPSFLQQALRGARASGGGIFLKKQKVAEVGDEISRKAEVASVIARVLSALPATFAERQGIDKIPASEQGLLDLGTWLDKHKAAVERRQARIEAIGAEIDRLAWALYKPKKVTKAPPKG